MTGTTVGRDMGARRTTRLRPPGPPAMYVRRVVVMEDPEVVKRLEALSRTYGRSLSAEVRAAVRYWLAEYEA